MTDELTGDLARFGDLADRVQGLVDVQMQRYRPSSSDWVVLPWTDGFYLFSEDSEGQRRGREAVNAFLGPHLVTLDTLPDRVMASTEAEACRSAGFFRASYLRRVTRGRLTAESVISRLEDMAAALSGRTWHPLVTKPSHNDLLRDFRLALIGMDDEASRALLDQLRLDGHMSAENLRYLRIEQLAAFGRWSEMRALPHVKTLLQARRPRSISEALLRMVWWTELAGQPQDLMSAFKSRGLMESYALLFRSIHVPGSVEGRLVCLLAALVDADQERQKAILRGAEDEEERASLTRLAAGTSQEAGSSGAISVTSQDPVANAYESGRFTEAVDAFLAAPLIDHVEIAIAAVLDGGITERASDVLAVIQTFIDAGPLILSRRAKRDLDDLIALASQVCRGWEEWGTRLAGSERWAAGSEVARNNGSLWVPVVQLDAQAVSRLCDALLEASYGANADQLRASLDILCGEAASILRAGAVNDFCHVVLEILAVQDNFSEMVRSAYADLFAAWLEVGPSSREYEQTLQQAADSWLKVASPAALSWAITLLESVVDLPCPDEAARTQFAVLVIESARRVYHRVCLRERVELEALADDLGLAVQEVLVEEGEGDVWAALDGKLVGLYTLLPRAASHLETRLRQLSSVGEVRGNQDKVATAGLRSLAQKADFFIVDTWHAAHQATAAIDAVRPREQQILPTRRGLSGFLSALETRLAG